MRHLIHHLRLVVVALTALALSAGLAFGATPEAASWGLANAASHAGKTVPVAGGQGDTAEDEETGEDEEVEETEETEEVEETETEESEEAGDNCSTDPTTLSEEELDELRHGSIVCWAAHQAEWPEWFTSKGQWVRCWAHHGKADAPSCMEDPNAEDSSEDASETESTVEGATAGAGKGNGPGANRGGGHGKGKGKSGRD